MAWLCWLRMCLQAKVSTLSNQGYPWNLLLVRRGQSWSLTKSELRGLALLYQITFHLPIISLTLGAFPNVYSCVIDLNVSHAYPAVNPIILWQVACVHVCVQKPVPGLHSLIHCFGYGWPLRLEISLCPLPLLMHSRNWTRVLRLALYIVYWPPVPSFEF